MHPGTLLHHHPSLHSIQALRTLGLTVSLFVCLALNASSALAQKTEADVFVAQAMLAYDDKQYEEALTLLRQALSIDSANIEALYYTGLAYNAQGKPAEAAQALELAYAQNATDPAIQFHLGVAYFILKQYDKSEPLLAEVFASQPEKDNLGYYVGFMRYRNKNYQGAIQAFSKGKSDDPDIQQLTKFYNGLALSIAGMPEEAASELEEAGRIRTVSPLTGAADRLRDTFVAKHAQQDRRLHGELRMGLFYDTNVSVNPLSSKDPLVLDLRARRTNTPGHLVSARGDYAWFRAGAWESTVTASLFRTTNYDIPFFNIGNYLGGTGLSYRGALGSLPYQIGTQYTFDYTTLSASRFMNRHSFVLQGTLVENAGNLTSLQFRYQNKDFSSLFLISNGTNPAEDRSADNYMIGLTHIFRFAGDKHLVRIGYQYDLEDAKGQDWFYRGHRLLAGIQYTLPWGETRLKYDFDYYYRRYPHPNAIFPTDAPNTVRQEVQEQNHIVRIEKPLPFSMGWGDTFVLAADFQATISRANMPYIFSYNRAVSTISLAWGF